MTLEQRTYKEQLGIYEVIVIDFSDRENLDGNPYKVLVNKNGKPFKGFGIKELKETEELIKIAEQGNEYK